MLNIGDDFTRDCVAAVVDASRSGACAVRELSEIIARQGRSCVVVSDNGTKMVSREIPRFTQDTGIKWRYVSPAKPVQNAFVENSSIWLRDECLASAPFPHLPRRPGIIEARRLDNNTVSSIEPRRRRVSLRRGPSCSKVSICPACHHSDLASMPAVVLENGCGRRDLCAA